MDKDLDKFIEDIKNNTPNSEQFDELEEEEDEDTKRS